MASHPSPTRTTAQQRSPRVATRPALVVVEGGRNQPTLITVPKGVLDEAHMELAVARDERVAHTAAVRRHVRVAMRALADGRYSLAGTWMHELDQLNEREAVRARATEVAAKPCPDGIRRVGHGRAA